MNNWACSSVSFVPAAFTLASSAATTEADHSGANRQSAGFLTIALCIVGAPGGGPFRVTPFAASGAAEDGSFRVAP